MKNVIHVDNKAQLKRALNISVTSKNDTIILINKMRIYIKGTPKRMIQKRERKEFLKKIARKLNETNAKLWAS